MSYGLVQAGPHHVPGLQVPQQGSACDGAAYMCTNMLYFVACLPPGASCIPDRVWRSRARHSICRVFYQVLLSWLTSSSPLHAAEVDPQEVARLEGYRLHLQDLFEGTAHCYPGQGRPGTVCLPFSTARNTAGGGGGGTRAPPAFTYLLSSPA